MMMLALRSEEIEKTEEKEGHPQKEEDPCEEEIEEGRGKPSSHYCVQH